MTIGPILNENLKQAPGAREWASSAYKRLDPSSSADIMSAKAELEEGVYSPFLATSLFRVVPIIDLACITSADVRFVDTFLHDGLMPPVNSPAFLTKALCAQQ